ncbi:unnamed protein product [Kuraishia capsulata CBS 1993]|uniref:Uncharacterized protein n=1 Tax=Kuraishia capsulata CBS 1993 TaxID=1382522 RepID=W6MP53_9ASCO|nr:uncharacterized protein KUCA_T00002836001 [Kuraishia capsulata CBS 1993]CDK26862.1 unnamed protein product [Kuraishia capsulata CBS 1993]
MIIKENKEYMVLFKIFGERRRSPFCSGRNLERRMYGSSNVEFPQQVYLHHGQKKAKLQADFPRTSKCTYMYYIPRSMHHCHHCTLPKLPKSPKPRTSSCSVFTDLFDGSR